jgi:hypothetical protein
LEGYQKESKVHGSEVTTIQLIAMAKAFYSGRIKRDFEAITLPKVKALFSEIGLTGDFWRVPEPMTSTDSSTSDKSDAKSHQ